MSTARTDAIVHFLRARVAARDRVRVVQAVARQIDIARRLRVAEALAALRELSPSDRAVVARLLRAHNLPDAAFEVWP